MESAFEPDEDNDEEFLGSPARREPALTAAESVDTTDSRATPTEPEVRPIALWGIGLAAAAVAAWRLAVVPAGRFWRDWALLLAIQAIAVAAAGRRRFWPALAAALMAYLLGIYVQAQWPHVADLF